MKNKHNLQRLIGGLIAVAGIGIGALGFIIPKASPTLTNVCLFIGGPLLIVGGIWYFIATQNSRSVCDNCGESMSGCAYEYQEKNRTSLSNGKYSVTVRIVATCPHCNSIKAFDKKFPAGDGHDNLQYQVDEFCRNVFGH